MKHQDKNILIVDDEEDILEFVSYNLKREGFKITTANNGRKAVELAKKIKPDLILLDVMMPEMDGIEVCEVVRRTPEISKTVIAMLTARAESYSQIAGFDAGADDYIIKPIRPKVLISRIKALLKRASYTTVGELEPTSETTRDFGDFSIDIEKHKVLINKNEVDFPKKEFSLLSLLTSKPEKVFTRDEIYSHVWGQDVVCDRTIDVYIRKIREKIGQDRIKTIKSVGYRFQTMK